MTRQAVIALGIFLALVAVVCAAGLHLYRTRALPLAVEGQAWALEKSLQVYHDDFGEFPAAETNAGITEALQRGNPRNRDYFLDVGRSYEVYIYPKTGEMVDVWGRPFRIDFDRAAGTARAVSAGPNGEFGDDDDIGSGDVGKFERRRKLQDSSLPDSEANTPVEATDASADENANAGFSFHAGIS